MTMLASLETLPGADLIRRGVADLDAGVESTEALLVSIGAPRLRSVGVAQFEAIEPELYRFPAIDPASFRQAVEDQFTEQSSG